MFSITRGNIMKLYAPRYYKDFKCIADRCPHSCCIGWEIDVDEDTLEKYKRLNNSYANAILNSISTEPNPHFMLAEHDRCPHLDERGLCKIILNAGEDRLCDICREHPRFYNFTSIAEVGIGMSCPEAARIILSSPDYADIEEIGCVEAEQNDIDFDGRADRNEIYRILHDTNDSYLERLDKIYRNYSIDPGDDSEWLEKLDSLEYLDPDHKKLFLNYASTRRPIGNDDCLERFLAYLIYRHCTEAFDTEDLRERLSFCLFCERLLASLIFCTGAESLQDVIELARIISEEIEYSNDNTLALTY